MRKHRHEAIIKEWLDNGMPPVEYRSHPTHSWVVTDFPSWEEDKNYRLVYPPKQKQVVTSYCWRSSATGNLTWTRLSGAGITVADWQRFPAGDITGEVEE